MKPKAQTMVDWIKGKALDLKNAMKTAQELGLAEGASSLDRVERRILDFFRSKGISNPIATEELWRGFLGRPDSRGSRLSDVAWWTGCEECDDVSRAPLVGDSIAAFWREYRPRISRYVAAAFPTKDEHFVDAVTVETFSHTYRYYWSKASTARYLGGARAIGLLQTMARHEALKQLRELDRTIPLDEDFVIPAESMDEPEDVEYEKERAAAIAECFEKLPPKCKIVATRRYVHGEEPGAIAKTMGVSAAAVTNHCVRAVAHLTKCLAARGFKVAL